MKEKEITINPDKLYTKTQYFKEFGVNRVKIDEMIKNKDLKSLQVNGTTLIIAK